MFTKKHGYPFLFILIAFILAIDSLPPVEGSSEEEMEFSRPAVNPSSGEEGTEFVFTVRVSSAAPPEHPVEVVVEGHAHAMKEVDPSDKNYSDGKDFQYKGKFEDGPMYYFFRCGDHTTRASTFDVKKERLIEYHPDLVLAMAIYTAPLIFFLLLLRRMTDTMIALTSTLKGIGESLEGEEPSTKEGDG